MMKRVLITILSVFFLSLAMSHAQMKFGIKAGATISNLKLNSDLLSVQNRLGYHVGPTVMIKFPFMGFGVDASALYDVREAKVEMTSLLGKQSLQRKQMLVPINLRYSFGLGTTTSFFVFAGPQFNFNIGSLEKDIFSSVTWNIKRSTLSGNVGAGLMFADQFQLTANYNMAFGKTSEFTLSDVTKTYNARNNAWQVALTYYF